MKDLVNDLMKNMTESQLWKSIFRHGYEDTSRNKVQQVRANVFLHLHPPRIEPHALKFKFTWCMGGITFLLFLIETFTGVLLMFYFRPVTEYAYLDIKYFMFDVPYGIVLRNVHRWGAHAMVATVMFHMLRVFLTGSYKKPREFNWVIGVNALVLTLLLSFSGYLLPWDQLAFWAITVGTNMVKATPFVGFQGPFAIDGITKYNDATYMLLGGTEVGAATLMRFYVLHIMVFPLVLAALIAVHFWRIRKDGFSGPL